MALPLMVIDTTVIVDILRGHEPAVDWALHAERRMTASEVTRVEVVRGLRTAERQAAERAFRGLNWIGVDEAIARRAGELGPRWRRSHHAIGLVDLIIAATALELDAPLATSNVRHYPMFEGLQPPYGEEPGR